MNVKQVICALTAVSLGFAATGCASSNTTKTVHAAPITYKIGDGAAQYASLSVPNASVTNTVPESYIPARPAPYTPEVAPAPVPAPSAPVASLPTPSFPQTFDQTGVDKDLYKHQRVGNTYTIMGKTYTPKHEPNYDVTGVASWYGPKFHGKPTATGEIYNQHDLTAAHKTLPLNSMLFVTNVENGKSLMVRLNDRGPFIGDRIIDLSQASAEALGIAGLGNVRVQYAGPADPMAANRAPVTPAVPVARPEENYVEAPIAAPQPAPAPYQAPQPAPTPYETPAPIAPRSPEAVAPQSSDPTTGNVTLTIKGPIHIARHEGTQPRLIRERLETK